MASSMEFTVRQTGDSSSEAGIRGHVVRFDRPQDKGGSDSAPMGGEVFLASVAGCLMSNVLAAMRARNIRGASADARVIGVLDGIPLRFTGIRIDVTVANVDRETGQKIVEIAEKGCIMMNTLRDKIDISVQLGED